MFKFTLRLSITFLLSFLLITSNALGFHKTYQEERIVYEDKNLLKDDIKAKYCAQKVKKHNIKDAESGFSSQEETEDGKLGWEVYGSHYSKIKINPGEKIIFAVPLKNNVAKLHEKKLDYKIHPDKTPLEEVLKILCLQFDEEIRPIKLGKSAMEELFKIVAIDNNLTKSDGKADLKKPLGINIWKDGLIINKSGVVYYLPDYLIDHHNDIETAKKNHQDDLDDKERIRIDNVNIQKSNDEWISLHKDDWIQKFEKKLTKYKNEITNLETKRNKLDLVIKNYALKIIEALEKIDESFDYVDQSKKVIRDKKREINENKKKYLNDIKLKEFKSVFKEIEKKNFNKYGNYVSIKEILDKAKKKSTKAKHFVGTESVEVFGITIKQKDMGFIQRYDDIKDKPLGSKTDEESMNTLKTNVDNQIILINNTIFTPIEEMLSLDEELSNKFPMIPVAIGFVIFLIICGGGYFVYDTSEKRKKEKKDSESKIASLKSDFEGKFKDTSEQIRKVGREGVAQQQKTPTQEPEKPKTQEEIIASKYDDLLSDYRDSLDDFSKVAAFKQKWNGLALSRKERQDGTKTILINSTRAFEKAEIWCVNFSDKYFAFPGSSVKSSMAAYMNMEFEKASRDFKGVFSISSGSSYSTEPAVLRRGGAGFVVERAGKLIFPN